MGSGNDRRTPFSSEDRRRAVAGFRAYLARRYAAQLAVPCPWAARARMQRQANTDIDTVLAATELTWCEVHQSAVSECPSPNPTFAARDVWGTPED
jgi:hypothetical protein